MATITHDAQSLMIDGRRFWIASGLIDYFRMPCSEWKPRLRDAIECGLNCVTVRCPWRLHEPRRGEYDFEDDLDVRAFVELIGSMGMRCILRVGPYIGSDIDLGGLPSWLLSEDGMLVRSGSAPFLDATSKYFRRLLEQFAPLSATKGGPIHLVQIEHEWYCGNPEAAEAYLFELARFIRERDFDVPMINTNNLWQHREESLDTWSGRENMLQNLRQLRTILRNSPLFVGDFHLGTPDTWNAPHAEQDDPGTIMQQLGQVVAAGAQYTLTPFAGGTNFGFLSGRVVGSADAYHTTSMDQNAPVTEDGSRSPLYHMIRRLCTFTSQFGRVFSAINPDPASAVLGVERDTASSSRSGARPGPAVVHLKGTQGQVVMVFGDEKKSSKDLDILLPDGTSIPIQFGGQPVVWCLLETHIGGRAVLNWTNLNAFATNNDDLLVLFGAPGQEGVVSINRSELELTVPRGHAPHVERHEDITIVVCNTTQIDATFLHNDTVHVGIAGFDEQGEPRQVPGFKRRYIINREGDVSHESSAIEPSRKPTVKFTDWKASTIDSYIEGTAPRFATIDGPTTQEKCAAGSGYGFLRLTLPKGGGKRARLMCPGVADRAHLYVKGALRTIVGYGPGATDGAFDFHLPNTKYEIVALIDNLGRFVGGNDMDEGKGLIQHIHEVGVLRTGKHTIVDSRPIRPFELKPYLHGMHANAASSARHFAWSFMHRRKSGIILELAGALTPAIIVVNDTPVGFYAGSTGRPSMRVVLDDEPLRRGKNEIRIAPIGVEPEESDIADAVKFYESKSVITEKAAWAFAKWQEPKATSYRVLKKDTIKENQGRPIWYRSTFTIDREPVRNSLWFEPTGLKKGQLYVNGKNVGRYFAATHEGKSVGPQKRLYLPPAWLKFGEDQKNKIVIFEEHGASPEKCRITAATSATD